MSTAANIHLEIDDRIKGQPTLCEAVNQATDFIVSQADRIPPPGEIRWSLADRDGKLTALRMSDTGTQPGLTAERNFWTRWLLDPVSRDLCVLKVWRELLRRRSDLQMERVNDLMTRLGEDGGADDAE